MSQLQNVGLNATSHFTHEDAETLNGESASCGHTGSLLAEQELHPGQSDI